jgi:trans-feruloyl-CoA hydratase/vanillin synthase
MAETLELETVTVEFDDGITTLTLDRPEKKNAINPRMIEEMHGEVMPALKADAYDPDGGTNVLVVTVAGDAFCGGMDLKEFFLENADRQAEFQQVGRINMEWFEDLYKFPRATIAAVNGWCVGGGLGLMCCCDLAIAAEDATMGLSEVRWGIIPAGGATYLPANTISRRDFLEASLMGREMDGEHAEFIRLVNKAVPGAELMEEVREWAEEIDELNPTVVQFAKEAYRHEMESNMNFGAATTYEVGRNRHLSDVIDRENVKALQAFADDKFKPGVETYSDEDIAEYDED